LALADVNPSLGENYRGERKGDCEHKASEQSKQMWAMS
jgi:hypothetical protein